MPGATLTVANYDALAPGTLVDLWHLPGGASDWQIIGEGQVTAGGGQVVTNAPGLPGGGYVFLAPKSPTIALSADNDIGYYLRRRRIEEAKRRLEGTAAAIDEISWKVGYGDPAFFRRLFKRLFAMTPGAYRRRFQLPDFAAN